MGLLWWLSGKEPACNAGDMGSIPGSGRSPGAGHGNSLQYSCLGNPMDWGVWLAIVHRVAKSWTCLKWQHTRMQCNNCPYTLYTYICLHICMCEYITFILIGLSKLTGVKLKFWIFLALMEQVAEFLGCGPWANCPLVSHCESSYLFIELILSLYLSHKFLLRCWWKVNIPFAKEGQNV